METTKLKVKRTSPTLHLLLFVLIAAVSAAGYLAIIWASNLRGYDASALIAIRNLGFLLPVFGIFFWLTRKQRFRGEMLLLTAAILLFAIGMLMQFRLFTDPEYGARGAKQAEERKAKAQAVRLLNIQSAYDDEKKTFMFGSPKQVPKEPANTGKASAITILGIATSPNTYIPMVAMLALVAGFLIFKEDKYLLWLQQHSLILGLATLIPFALLVLVFSDEGKFLGQTTPWEGVKIFFLLSFAGMLADTFRHLQRTRWGLPPARYFFPFLVIAAMPVVPFFALSDFGQMLVFFAVYCMLYIIAVRKKIQLAYAVAAVALLFLIFVGVSKIAAGSIIPGRLYFRFYSWQHIWEPPPPNTWWWKKSYEKYLKDKNLKPDPNDEQEIKQRNQEAWNDKVRQPSQGLFGINEGGVTGAGLGLGYPETISVSDSDFIYAAIAEETGLLGGGLVLLGLAVIIFSGTAISIGATDMFTKLLAAGFTAFIGFQAIVNIGGVLRFLPMTGITLPFVSHGGWSLITSFAMLGILLAFSHRNALTNQAQAEKQVESEPQFLPVQ
ncbi:MAG: FtsW/RodA/SpoVE family cell cycle protein [Acidobacteria bacterium]|nr:FtsW/RodA/SpoVE family cell cycle protein [Acidobacteriota bacterium]